MNRKQGVILTTCLFMVVLVGFMLPSMLKSNSITNVDIQETPRVTGAELKISFSFELVKSYRDLTIEISILKDGKVLKQKGYYVTDYDSNTKKTPLVSVFLDVQDGIEQGDNLDINIKILDGENHKTIVERHTKYRLVSDIVSEEENRLKGIMTIVIISTVLLGFVIALYWLRVNFVADDIPYVEEQPLYLKNPYANVKLKHGTYSEVKGCHVDEIGEPIVLKKSS